MADYMGMARDLDVVGRELEALQKRHEEMREELFRHIREITTGVDCSAFPKGDFTIRLDCEQRTYGTDISARMEWLEKCFAFRNMGNVVACDRDFEFRIEDDKVCMGGIGEDWFCGEYSEESHYAEFPVRWLGLDGRDLAAEFEELRVAAEAEQARADEVVEATKAAAERDAQVRAEEAERALYDQLKAKYGD